jgi:hypothetical protein
MNTDILHQEIMLLTDTNFAHRQIVDKENKGVSGDISNSEKMENACWAGLLVEMLPELIENKELCLWQIMDTGFSLQIELSPYPSWERKSSIDPYYFLKTLSFN